MNNRKGSITALVPMKAHSERVKDKNIREFAGKPLFCSVVSELLESPFIKRILIDTDSLVIKQEMNNYFPNERVTIIDRPNDLCGDFAPFFEILKYDMGFSDTDLFLQTHATNPLLTEKTISDACKYFIEHSGEYDSLFSVNEWHTRLYDKSGKAINHDPNHLIRTQDLEPIFEENSNLYIFSRDSFYKRNNRIGENPYLYKMSMLESVDIDTEDEFRLAEAIYLGRNRKN